jgi:hypothetical protein
MTKNRKMVVVAVRVLVPEGTADLEVVSQVDADMRRALEPVVHGDGNWQLDDVALCPGGTL